MFRLCVVFTVLIGANAGPATEPSFRGQFCVDPRTMRKHAAYTEWADAYSCTRHRCQPGGRNLAIYTVGCKRVEAPESAIECEEVVEDTNMQFPYCCTRLRCLVVVRGEVWTRVLGQPWETLPAAPWSHMYKMKKPPPGSEKTFLPKLGEGPVYELQRETMTDDESGNKVLRTKKSKGGEALAEDCNTEVSVSQGAPQQPDIVIALSTNLDKEVKKEDVPPGPVSMASKSLSKYPRSRSATGESFFDEEAQTHVDDEGFKADEPLTLKPVDPIVVSEERSFQNSFSTTPKPFKAPRHPVAWTEIPQNQWNEHDPDMDIESLAPKAEQPAAAGMLEDGKGKGGNLQALVDAIGTRMRDIESAVQRMSEKVHKAPDAETGSGEKLLSNQLETEHHDHEDSNMKKPAPEAEAYRRSSRYLHKNEDSTTTEPPLFIEDSHLNGYFSDASNTVLRRSMPVEPAATYMAPVQSLSNRRKTSSGSGSEDAGDQKPHKKRMHKKKRTKAHHKKRHPKDDKRKKFRLNSVELNKNAVSLEDSDNN